MSDAKTLNRAKSLRASQTNTEQRLWYHLRAHRFMGLKFKRQKPLGCYIVDFVCVEQRLIVEIDGGQHAEQLEYDRCRDAWLRGQGYTVLRFWNNEVLQQLEAVLEQIRLTISLSPGPSPMNGRGENVTSPASTPLPSPASGRGAGTTPLPSSACGREAGTTFLPSPACGRGAGGEGKL